MCSSYSNMREAAVRGFRFLCGLCFIGFGTLESRSALWLRRRLLTTIWQPVTKIKVCEAKNSVIRVCSLKLRWFCSWIWKAAHYFTRLNNTLELNVKRFSILWSSPSSDMLLFDGHCTAPWSDEQTKSDNCSSSEHLKAFSIISPWLLCFIHVRQTVDSSKETDGPKLPDRGWNKQTMQRWFSYLFGLLFSSSRHLDLRLTLSLFNMCKLSNVHQGSSHLASFVVTKAARQMCGRPPAVRDAPRLTARRRAKTSLTLVNCFNDEKET